MSSDGFRWGRSEWFLIDLLIARDFAWVSVLVCFVFLWFLGWSVVISMPPDIILVGFESMLVVASDFGSCVVAWGDFG